MAAGQPDRAAAPLRARLARNARFLVSMPGHWLPGGWMRALQGARYPDYRNRDYRLCIEGVQRSGNTFFVALFQHWNPGVPVAHHTHLASSVRTAVARGLPAVVLLRSPEDAAASLVAWNPLLAVSTALASGIAFHRAAWGRRAGLAVLRFEDAVAAPGPAIDAINRRFGTAFHGEALDPGVRERVMQRIDDEDRRLARDAYSSSLPNEEKRARTAQLRPVVTAHPLYPLAARWYRRYRELALAVAPA